MLSNFAYVKGTVIKAQGNNSRMANIQLDQWSGIESPEATPDLCGERTKHRDSDFSANAGEKTGQPHAEK